MLISIGFVCFVLPGIYMAVAWMFALSLVVDKQLDFWVAMEFSRKVVSKHWWKFFGFWLVLILLNLAGVLACGIGVFITAPVSFAAVAFAYQDIFGLARATDKKAGVGAGPHGTDVLGAKPATRAPQGRPVWQPVLIILFALLFLMCTALFLGARANRHRVWQDYQAAASNIQPGETATEFVLGPVIERMIEFTNFNRRALILASGNYVASNGDRSLDFGPQGTEALRAAGVDLFLSEATFDEFKKLSLEEKENAPVLNVLDWTKTKILPSESGDGPFEGNIKDVDLAMLERLSQQNTNETDDAPNPEAIIQGTNVILFVTRDGTHGVLQMDPLREAARGVRLRYKLVKEAQASETFSRASLSERLEAAGGIGSETERCAALASVATDAAQAGQVELVNAAIQQITESTVHDQTALDAARFLAKRKLRKQGIAIARNIFSNEIRDQALSELAR
jgi:hypothetical protein